MSNQQSLIVANENSNSSSSGYAFSSTMSSRSVTDSISMKEKSINDYPSTTCSHSRWYTMSLIVHLFALLLWLFAHSQGSVLWATNFQMAWSFTSSLSGPFWPSATSSFKCLNLPRVKSISGLDNLKLSSKGKMVLKLISCFKKPEIKNRYSLGNYNHTQKNQASKRWDDRSRKMFGVDWKQQFSVETKRWLQIYC